ncbi:MAG: VOC family protein [Bradymonadia bacterium]
MITAIRPYINCRGNAAEAITLYEKVLGAETQSVMHWRDMPGDVPAGQAHLVMHAELKVGDTVIMLSDAPHTQIPEPQSLVHISLQLSKPEMVDEIYAAFADGGESRVKPDNTFWNARFAMVIDRFGIGWMLNCDL